MYSQSIFAKWFSVYESMFECTPNSSFQQTIRRIRRIWMGVNRKNRLLGVESCFKI